MAIRAVLQQPQMCCIHTSAVRELLLALDRYARLSLAMMLKAIPAASYRRISIAVCPFQTPLAITRSH